MDEVTKEEFDEIMKAVQGLHKPESRSHYYPDPDLLRNVHHGLYSRPRRPWPHDPIPETPKLSYVEWYIGDIAIARQAYPFTPETAYYLDQRKCLQAIYANPAE